MTDRFKFRVWNKTAKKYLMCPYIRIDDADDKAYISCDNDEVLEQCTGLKDKKGKLIYEGDIVRVDAGGLYTESMIMKVVFNTLTLSYDLRERSGWCDRSLCLSFGLRSKVIGNIHENWDLLK